MWSGNNLSCHFDNYLDELDETENLSKNNHRQHHRHTYTLLVITSKQTTADTSIISLSLILLLLSPVIIELWAIPTV